MVLRQQQMNSQTSALHVDTSTAIPSSSTNSNITNPDTPNGTSVLKRQSFGSDPTLPLPLSHYIKQVQAAMMCLALQIEEVEPSSEDELRSWISKLENGHDPSGIDVKKMTSASETMTLFIKTLLKQPEVPRYRKIAATNFAFKNSLAGLIGIDRLFSATGFILRGNSWEWEWYVPSDAVTATVGTQNSSVGTPARNGKMNPPPPSKEEWTEILQLAVDSLAFLKSNQKVEMLKSYLPGAPLRRPSIGIPIVTNGNSQSNGALSNVSVAVPHNNSQLSSINEKHEKQSAHETKLVEGPEHVNDSSMERGKSVGIAMSNSPYSTTSDAAGVLLAERGVSLLQSNDQEVQHEEPPSLSSNSNSVSDVAFLSGIASSGPGPLRFEDVSLVNKFSH